MPSENLLETQTAADEQPLSFSDVSAAHYIAQRRDPFFAGMTLQQFSRYMNQENGTTRYSAGDVAGLTKAASGYNSMIEEGTRPMREASGDVGARLGALIGPKTEEVGRSVGESLPRTAVQAATLASGATAPLGLADVFSQSLAGNHSVPGAVAQTAAFGLAPQAGKVVGQVAEQAAAPLGSLISKGVGYAGAQAGTLGALETGGELSSLVSGHGLYNPVEPRHVAETVASLIPFAALDLVKLGFAATQKSVVERAKDAQAATVLRDPTPLQAASPPIAQAREATGVSSEPKVLETVNGVDQFALPGTEVQPMTWMEHALQKANAGMTGRQLLMKIPEPLHKEIPGVGVDERAKYLKQNVLDPLRAGKTPGVATMWRDSDLQGQTFGTIASEQANLPNPFKLLPGTEGTLPGNSLLQGMKRMLPEVEWETLQKNGLEGFLKDKKVPVPELQQWLKANGLQVETKVLSSGSSKTPEYKEALENAGQLRHQLDTLRPTWTQELGDTKSLEWSPEVKGLYMQWSDATDTINRQETRGGFDPDQYRNITPHHRDQTVVMVRVPVRQISYETRPGSRDNVGDILHQGHHLGSEDKNVLGFARMYFTDVGGKKVAHVFEVQSDWHAQVKSTEAARQQHEAQTGYKAEYERDINHPLLRDNQRLVLKAAIKHALDQGAEGIMVSDGETAMMTEGHDLNRPQEGSWGIFNKAGEFYASKHTEEAARDLLFSPDGSRGRAGWTVRLLTKEDIQPTQAKGMRLNYNEILPRIMKELTGYEGSRVSAGEHANAFSVPLETDEGTFADRRNTPRSDLIFQNSDGTPKTDATGVLYPLDKVRAELARRGGFSLVGKDKILSTLKQMERDGASPEQMALAKERLLTLYMRSTDKGIEDAIAREAGLGLVVNEEGQPGDLLRTTQTFFQKLFYYRGFDDIRAKFLTDNAIRLASYYAHLVGKTRVVEALGRVNFAASPRGDRWNGIVAILKTQGAKDVDLETFNSYWSFAHELSHQVEFASAADKPEISPEHIRAYQKTLAAATDMSLSERQETVRVLLKSLVPGDLKTEDWQRVVQGTYTDPTEFIADYHALLAIGAANPSTSRGFERVKDLTFFGAEDTKGFAQGLYKDLTQMVSSVKEYLKRVFGPKENTVGVKQMLQNVEQVHENLVKLLASHEQAEAAVHAFLAMDERQQAKPWSEPPSVTLEQIQHLHNTMRAYDPGTIGLSQMPSVGGTSVDVHAAEEVMMPPDPVRYPERLKWYDYLKPLTQLARSFPQLRGVSDIGLNYLGMASQAVQGIWERIDADPSMAQRLVEKVGRDGMDVNTLINKMHLVQNADPSHPWFNTPELIRARFPQFDKLTKENQEHVVAWMGASGQVAVQTGTLRMSAQRNKVETAVARTLQIWNPGQRPEALQIVAKGLVGLHTVGEVKALPAGFGAGLTSLDKAVAVATSAKAMYDKSKIQLLGEDGKGKPWYAPEVRIGDWSVAYTEKGGKAQLWGFKTKKEADARLASLNERNARGELEYLQAFNRTDKNDAFRGLSPDLILMYQKGDDLLYQAVLKNLEGSGADKATLERLQKQFQPGAGAYAEVKSPYMRERRLVGGREGLNMVEGMIQYISSTGHGVAKQFAKGEAELHLHAPDLVAAPNLQNAARNALSAIIDPKGTEFTTFKNLIFFNFMGLNPSSLLVEQTQQLASHAPYLVQQGAGIGEAMKYIVRATQAVGGSHMSGRKGTYTNPELDSLVVNARHDRVVDTGLMSELQAQHDVTFANRKTVFDGNGKVGEVTDMLRSGLYHTLRLARNFYGLSTVFNSESALVSSYLFAREKLKMDVPRATKFARDAVKTTMYGGGIANRPLALYGLGKAQGVGGIMYALNSYTFNTVAMMCRLGKEAIGRSPGLTPAQRTASRKAFGLMMGVQAMVGGVMGLPIVGGLVALIDQFYPEAEVKKHMRETFFKMGGEDDDMGHPVADGAMRGVFNLGPVDFGSRFSLGNMLGVDPSKGFSWKNVVGPAASMLENYVGGAQLAAQGEGTQALEKVVPAGLRGLAQLLRDGGDVRSPSGEKILDLTSSERALLAVGLKPKRITQHYEEQAIRTQSEKVASTELTGFHEGLAQRLEQGDVEGVRNALYDRQQQTANYDIQQGVRRVVDAYQSRTSPVESGRRGTVGNVGNTHDIRRMYEQGETPSEVQRLQNAVQKERLIGVRGTGQLHKQEVRVAQMVDQVRAMNPSLTRTEALLMVQRQLNPGRQVLRFGQVGS